MRLESAAGDGGGHDESASLRWSQETVRRWWRLEKWQWVGQGLIFEGILSRQGDTVQALVSLLPRPES